MPEVSKNIENWKRGGGRLTQNKNIVMTKDEKANVALCKGIKSDHPCKNPLFRCENCGNYGCTQETADKCTEQGFKNDICLECGVKVNLIPIMADELTSVEIEWEINHPV